MTKERSFPSDYRPRSKIVEPKLRIRIRLSPFAAVLPAVRGLSLLLLTVVVIIAGIQWLRYPLTAGALEFTPHTVSIATSAVGVLGIAAGKLDGGDTIDIATAGLDGVKVYKNSGEKKFEAKIVEEIDAERVQIVELNNDNQPDLLVTLAGRSPGIKWYRNTGGLEFAGSFIGTGRSVASYAGDLDGDRAIDVVTATDEGGNIVLRRWMNDGSGSFTSTTLNDNSKVKTVHVSDINGNGYPDIVTGGDNGLQRWSTSNGVTWTRSDIDDQNKNKTHITTGDTNGDRKIDIITADEGNNTVTVYVNQDNTSWKRVVVDEETDAHTVQVIDLDGDGDEDIVATSQDDNSVEWFSNLGSNEFSKQTIADKLQSVFGVAAADIDSDNDIDVVSGDHFKGTVFWYERIQTKPVASEPNDISQSTDGSGRVTFTTVISDSDGDTSSLRVQYSLDANHWYKPWLTKVTASSGSIDLKNSNGYQIGTSNPIDTDKNDEVTLTFTWDTKSVENTGGPIVGEAEAVQIRLIPRDKRGAGLAVASDAFVVDNQGPRELSSPQLVSADAESFEVEWNQPEDSSDFSYQLYYGTDSTAVLEKRSEVWDENDDAALADGTTTTTIVAPLSADTKYTLKLFTKDAFGNSSSAPSVRFSTAAAESIVEESFIESSDIPITEESIVPEPSFSPSPTTSPDSATTPSPTPSLLLPSPSPSPLPSNQPPTADAGIDQVVNPSALVILDGSSSSDPDRDRVTYAWRQLDGPAVELLSKNTAHPSFSALATPGTYIFALAVRDEKGTIATDTVTVAVTDLPAASSAPVAAHTASVPPAGLIVKSKAFLNVFFWIDIGCFVLALLSTLLILVERLVQAIGERRSRSSPLAASRGGVPHGQVVQYRTGEAIANAHVLIYGSDNKLRATHWTDAQGRFSTLFPPGVYTIGVEAPGFTVAATAALAVKPENGILYTGGKITVRDQNLPLNIVIPLRPSMAEVSSFRAKFLHLWQTIQRLGRRLSWPLFVVGALLNTALVFLSPSVVILLIEVAYVLLVFVRIVVEIRIRPAYGVVRDAITHVPLDLAVVRLFTADTNRLVMTRVTNNQGKFFALPPPGNYTITITKPGYAPFSKGKVEITDEHDATLQLTADLLPVTPLGGLQQAKAAVI